MNEMGVQKQAFQSKLAAKQQELDVSDVANVGYEE